MGKWMISYWPGLEVGGYLDSMLNTVPSLYYASVVGSFLLLAWAYHRHKERLQQPPESDPAPQPEPDPAPGSEQEQEPVSFEISATDECEFVPLVSEEEDRRIAAEIAPKSKYMELDPNQPGVIKFFHLVCNLQRKFSHVQLGGFDNNLIACMNAATTLYAADLTLLQIS